MSYLSSLVLIKIFKNNLNIEDRLSCKLVCKRFYEIIKLISPTNSLIIHSGSFGHKKWAFTNDHLQYSNSIEWTYKKNLNYQCFEFNFSEIQRLYLDNCHSYSSSNKFIIDNVQFFKSFFKQLRQLEKHSLKLAKIEIDLNFLKVLTLKGCLIYNLQINTPQLEALIIWNYFGEIDLKNLEGLKYFQCDEHYSDILNFKNLEYLDCKFINPIDRSIIKRLPKLKLLNLYSYLNQPILLNELIEERSRLGRNEFKIPLLGFQEFLVNQQFFYTDDTHCYSLNENNMKIVRANYQRIITQIPWTTKCDYTVLSEHFNGQIPNDFHSKFININEIEFRIDEKFNENDLIEFLIKCNSIQLLTIDELTEK